MISVIICSADPARASAATRNFSRILTNTPYELILMERPHSIAQAYNQAITASRGEVLVFAHDDLEILTSRFAERLCRHLETFDILGVAGTTRLQDGHWVDAGPPYIFGKVAEPVPNGYGVFFFSTHGPNAVGGIQSVDGLFIACRRQVVEALRFDEVTFNGFHLFDSDFCFTAYHAGFRLGVSNDIPILHASHGRFEEEYYRYKAIFNAKWQGRLAPDRGWLWNIAVTTVRTKAEILEAMGLDPEPELCGESTPP